MKRLQTNKTIHPDGSIGLELQETFQQNAIKGIESTYERLPQKLKNSISNLHFDIFKNTSNRYGMPYNYRDEKTLEETLSQIAVPGSFNGYLQSQTPQEVALFGNSSSSTPQPTLTLSAYQDLQDVLNKPTSPSSLVSSVLKASHIKDNYQNGFATAKVAYPNAQSAYTLNSHIEPNDTTKASYTKAVLPQSTTQQVDTVAINTPSSNTILQPASGNDKKNNQDTKKTNQYSPYINYNGYLASEKDWIEQFKQTASSGYFPKQFNSYMRHTPKETAEELYIKKVKENPISLSSKDKFVGLNMVKGNDNKYISNCFTLCDLILKKHDCSPDNRGSVYKLMEEFGGISDRKLGHYCGRNLVAPNYRNAINSIDEHLEAGYPIKVGVNHTVFNTKNKHELKNEGATDHFIVINGRGYDYTRKLVYYTYYEVGTARDKGYDTQDNRLFYDPWKNKFYDPVAGANDDKRYDVTQVRPNYNYTDKKRELEEQGTLNDEEKRINDIYHPKNKKDDEK